MYVNILSTSAVLLALFAACQFAYSANISPVQTNSEDTVLSFGEREHNLELGKRLQGDRLLNHTDVILDASWIWYVKYDFKYLSEEIDGPMITFVNVTNCLTGKNGGYPILVQGGPQYTGVEIRLESQWRKGIHFSIDVYGVLVF